jgi:hypothetical protein
MFRMMRSGNTGAMRTITADGHMLLRVTHRNRRNLQRVALFFVFACAFPITGAAVAHLLGIEPPRWLPTVCIAFAAPVASLLAWALERREDERLRRAMQPYCLKCGYDLTGNASGVCPECGNRFVEV